MLRRQEELENGTAWSISSESSDDSSSPQLPGSARHAVHKPIVQPELQASAPAIEISFSQQPQEAEPGTGASIPTAESQPEEPGSRKKEVVANGHVPYSRTLSHISEASVDATMEAKAAESPWELGPSPQDTGTAEQDMDPVPGTSVAAVAPAHDRSVKAKPCASVAWATFSEAEPVQSQAPSRGGCSTGVLMAPAQASTDESPVTTTPLPISVPEVPQGKMVDSGLEEAISLLGSALDDYRGQFPELHPLERELKHLEEMLLVRSSLQHLDKGDRLVLACSAWGLWRQGWLCLGTRVMEPPLMAVPRDNRDGAILLSESCRGALDEGL